MPTVAEHLARVPTEIQTLSHTDLARRAWRRSVRRRALATGAITFTAMGAVFVFVNGAATTGRSDAPTSVAASPVAPNGIQMSNLFGSWSSGGEMPFEQGATTFHGRLSDGRVLVWASPPSRDRDPRGEAEPGSNLTGASTAGGIYDVSLEEWEAIPAMPIAVAEPSPMLADDRLLVVGQTAGGQLGGAVYDATMGSWTQLPGQGVISIFADAVAWDGSTAVLVRLDPGAVGHGSYPSVDWRSSEPVTLRWRMGDESWRVGSPPPLSSRFGAGVLAESDSIVVVGGTEADVRATEAPPQGSDFDPMTLADGAVYDLSEDRWASLPDLPQAGIHPRVGRTQAGRLVAGAALNGLSITGSTGLGASWVLEDDEWAEVPSSPSADARPVVRDGFMVTESLRGRSGPHPVDVMFDGAWEQAPLGDLHRWGDLVIATSATSDNPGENAFAVRLRAGEGAWLQGAEAPFANRMDAVVEVVGNQLVVVGGFEGPRLDPTRSVWVLDLSAGPS